MKVFFSVIVPTYNHGYVLWRAILSILAQSFPFFEILIIDDASTDDTNRVVKVFTDPRIRYFKLKKNSGPSGARNYALKKARGSLIAYLDSDNEWHKDFLEVMKSSFDKYPEKILLYAKKNYRLSFVERNNSELKEKRIRDEITNHKKFFDLKRLWHRRILIDTNTMCHRKKEILELGAWDENLAFWEDWELTLRISKVYPDGFLYLNRSLVNYEQKINLEKADEIFNFWEEEEKKIFEKHKGHPLLEGQNWFPPQKGNKSTLGVIDYLRKKKSS